MMRAVSYTVLIGGVPVPTSRQARPRTLFGRRCARASTWGRVDRPLMPLRPNPVQKPTDDNADLLKSSVSRCALHVKQHAGATDGWLQKRGEALLPKREGRA